MPLKDISIRTGRCDLCERVGVEVKPDVSLFVCVDRDDCRETNYKRFVLPLEEKRERGAVADFTPAGFQRTDDGSIRRDVWRDGRVRGAIIVGGEDGFNLTRTSPNGTTSMCFYKGLTFMDAIEKARAMFRKVGVDYDAR